MQQCYLVDAFKFNDITDLSLNKGIQEKVKNNYPKLQWVPRVVAIEETDVNTLGSTFEVGLCGASAQALGFCVEAWVILSTEKRRLPMASPPWYSPYSSYLGISQYRIQARFIILVISAFKSLETLIHFRIQVFYSPNFLSSKLSYDSR